MNARTSAENLNASHPAHVRKTDQHLVAKWGYPSTLADIPPTILQMAQQSQEFSVLKAGEIVSDVLKLATKEEVETLLSDKPGNVPLLEHLAQRIDHLRPMIPYILALQNGMPYYHQITLPPHTALKERQIKDACTKLGAVLTSTPTHEPCLIFAEIKDAKEYSSAGRATFDPIYAHFGRKPIPAIAPRSEVSKYLEIDLNKTNSDVDIVCITPSSAKTDAQRSLIQIIERAISQNASNIAIQPELDGMTIVRFRVHGNMVDQTVRLSPEIALEFASTLHQWSGAAYLGNHQTVQGLLQGPADGSFTFRSSENEVFVRASFTPPDSLGGARLECISLRLMVRDKLQPKLADLRIQPDVITAIKDALHEQNGLILLVGATSSGKSTTIHGTLEAYMQIHGRTRNCLSVEDPVERLAPGLVSHSITNNYGFDHMMSALLRQDPDAIYIGEIRDRSSASIAIRAANSGHIVFSSLHANDAPSAIGALRAYIANRTVDNANAVMVSDFDLVQSLNLIVAQQLVPELCPHCRQKATKAQQDEFMERYFRYLTRHGHLTRDPKNPNEFSAPSKTLIQHLGITIAQSYLPNPTGCDHPRCVSGEIGSLPINEYLAPDAACKQQLIDMLAGGRMNFERIKQYRGKTLLEAAMERVAAGQTGLSALYI